MEVGSHTLCWLGEFKYKTGGDCSDILHFLVGTHSVVRRLISRDLKLAALWNAKARGPGVGDLTHI